MGQVEKFFVISIIVLVIIVVGVTLFGGDNPVTANNRQGAFNDQGQADLGPSAHRVPVLGDSTPSRPERPREGGASATTGGEEETDPGRRAANSPGETENDPPPPVRTAPNPPRPQPEPALPSRVQTMNGMPYVVVRKGDTLSQIMQDLLGSGYRYKEEVLELNEDLDPDNMRKGARIWLPARRLLPPAERADRERTLAAIIPPRTPAPRGDSYTLYKTRKGDSLWRIAQKFYGTGKAGRGVGRIKEANRDVDLEPLPPETTLKIPK